VSFSVDHNDVILSFFRTFLLVVLLVSSACTTLPLGGRDLGTEIDKTAVPWTPDLTASPATTASTTVPTTIGTSDVGASSTVSTSAPSTTTTTTAATTTTVPVQVGPVEPGSTQLVGDWELTVLAVNRDAADVVLAENSFNDSPVENHQFVLVRIAARYVGSDSKSIFAGLSYSTVGANEIIYDYSDNCGVFPDDLQTFTEVFPGGLLVGNVCWAVPATQVNSLELRAEPAFSFEDLEIAFVLPADGLEWNAPATSADPPVDEGVGSRGNPLAVGSMIELGSWSITVIGSADITDAVLAENQFNDPPPEGTRFVGVDLSAEYQGAEPATFSDEIAVVVVGPRGVAYSFESSCGVVPNPLNRFDDVTPASSLRGYVCWAVQESDIDQLVLIVDSIDERLFLAVR
jgi:hypothetical protein